MIRRSAIARALLTEAPIIVLDEPTSALDAEHERMTATALQKLKGQRTIILVSHRLSTVRGCDQIFMMHGGRVVEHGTHAELIARRGFYYQMGKFQWGTAARVWLRRPPEPPDVLRDTFHHATP